MQLFADAFDQLLGAVARKRSALLGEKLDSQDIKLPAELGKPVAASLEAWRRAGNVRRLWAGDAGLWTGADEAQWLGWLSIVDEQRRRIKQLKGLAEQHPQGGVRACSPPGHGWVEPGAGGACGDLLAGSRGTPNFWCSNSTDPAQICTIESRIDPARTYFSCRANRARTLEPNILKQYFFERAKTAVGAERAGSRFIAITDPGSKLQHVAERDRFRHIAYGKPSIGGRYSVLSDFGLVPAALMGLDIRETAAIGRADGALVRAGCAACR